MLPQRRTFAAVIAAGLAGLAAALTLHALGANTKTQEARPPVWTEVAWPFPTDPWGRGKAFRCQRADCGAEVTLYVRAKIGFCNCTTGVADDNDLDRMGDLDLVGDKATPLLPGRAVVVGQMRGRSRVYAIVTRNRAATNAISVAVNDRCDMIVATVVLPHDRAAAFEPDVIAFLNTAPVLRWAEVTLGL